MRNRAITFRRKGRKRHRTSSGFLPGFSVPADVDRAGDFVETDGAKTVAQLSTGKVDCCCLFCVSSHSDQQLRRVGFCYRSCLADLPDCILHFLVDRTIRTA